MPNLADVIEVAGNAASILTAVIAVWALWHFQITRWRRRRRLETYLLEEKGTGEDGGLRTVLHLVAQLGMTEAEIIDAAFRSKVIDRKVSRDEQGRADRLLLVHKLGDRPRRPGRAQF